MVMDMLKCPIKTEDETKIFKEVLQSLSARSPTEMNNIIQQMSAVNKKRVRGLLTTATVEYTDDTGAKQSVARRIVKVVRRPGVGTTAGVQPQQ